MMNLKGREGCYLTTWTKIWKRGDMASILISTLGVEKGKTSCEYHLTTQVSEHLLSWKVIKQTCELNKEVSFR